MNIFTKYHQTHSISLLSLILIRSRKMTSQKQFALNLQKCSYEITKSEIHSQLLETLVQHSDCVKSGLHTCTRSVWAVVFIFSICFYFFRWLFSSRSRSILIREWISNSNWFANCWYFDICNRNNCDLSVFGATFTLPQLCTVSLENDNEPLSMYNPW